MDYSQRILNCIESVEADHDWDYQTAIASGFFTPKALRPIVDYRIGKTWWTIGDQKDTGSCVGWAVVDSCLRWHFTEEGILPKTESLSVRFVWMASKEKDEFNKRPTSFIEQAGTSIKAALDILRKYGCVAESDLTFDCNNLALLTENKFYSNASKYKILNYFNLRPSFNDELSYPEIWKQWLNAGNGPIIVRLNIDNNWRIADKDNHYLKVYEGMPSDKGGHAATIVGYKDDNFIVRNSIGTDWGDEGYVYVSMEYANKAFQEAYGICIRFKPNNNLNQ
jgi:Papain family cysteine protease